MIALDQALSIEPSEQALRFAKDLSYVASQTVVQWVAKNLCELRSSVRSLSAIEKNPLAGHLNVDAMLEDYRAAKTRAIFVDNEGTIAAKAGWSIDTSDGSMTALQNKGTPPDEHVLDCLQTLAYDRNNTVVVLSGRAPKALDRWFCEVKGLGLCAEHGFHWLPPNSLRPKHGDPEEARNWRCMATGDDAEASDEWKAIVFELMKQYVKRVQGSILEYKDSAISWNYRGVGAPTVTALMARELARFLDPEDPNGVMHGYPVQVYNGKGYVEVKRSDVDKGIAVARVLDELQQHLRKPVDFVLCIGDDRSDEDMFEAIAKLCQDGCLRREASPLPKYDRFKRRSASKESVSKKLTSEARRERGSTSTLGDFMPDELRGYTVTVGRKPSKAQYFVHDVREVSLLLRKLSAQTVISSFSRFSSLPNLLAEGDSEEDSPRDPGNGSVTCGHSILQP